MALYSKLKPQLYFFLSQLENYNEVPFNKEIERYGYSVGFVFKELCEDFNLRIIPGIEACLSGGDENSKGKTFKGVVSMMFNKGVRCDKRTMAEEYSSHNFFGISVIRDEIYRIMKRMEALDKEVLSMNKSDARKNKSKHIKLGYLNASEWFALASNNTERFKSLKLKLDKEI